MNLAIGIYEWQKVSFLPLWIIFLHTHTVSSLMMAKVGRFAICAFFAAFNASLI